MDYSFNIVSEDNFLYFVISGIRTRESIALLAADVIATCREKGCKEAIADIRDLEGRLTIFESYSFVYKEVTALNKLNVLDKLVMVDRPENSERIRFFGQVAQRLGYNIHVYTDIKEAYASFGSTYREIKTVPAE